jgi:hypothetical protein
MGLTVEEVHDAYSVLVRAAKHHGLDWVVTQVESQIALGRIRTGKVRAKEVPLRGTPEEEIERMSKGRPAKFTVSDEYSAHEKLKILIEALQQAVCGVWRTASAVSGFMSDNIPNLSAVKFLPDGISKEPFSLEARDIHVRKQSVETFEALIQELKEAI